MPVVSATEIVRSFGAHRVLDGVSLSVHRGERVGIVGVNGSGKSTLGKILAAVDVADSGEVKRRRDARVLYLEQSPVLPAATSARDVALSGLAEWCRARSRYEELSRQISVLAEASPALGEMTRAQGEAAEELERLGGWDLVHRAESILGHVGIDDPDREAVRMSGGEQRRIALARLLIARPELAILDEPTNHLDVATVGWLERHLREDFAGAIVLITHDRYLLDRVATRTVEVGNGSVFSYDGGYEMYLQAKAEREAHDRRTERNRQNFLRSELEWLRRQPKARSGKSRSRIQRIENVVAQKVRQDSAVARIGVAEERSGKTILELHSVGIDVGGQCLVEGLDLHLTQGERIGVIGANGCGKTTLLRCLTGEIAPSRGEVVRGANTRVAYLDQTRGALDDGATVYENVIGDLASVRIGDRDLTPRSYLESFLFEDAAQRSLVGLLSGGERARVALASMLAAPANVMVLDEPTNDLDIATLAALETFLLEFGGVSIVVTHDRFFLDRVATSILAFEESARVERYHGSCSQYLEEKRSASSSGAGISQAVARRKARAAEPKLSYSEERELAALPDRIEVAERSIGETEAALADPTLYAERGAEVAEMVQALDALKLDLEELMRRWEELETKRESASRRP